MRISTALFGGPRQTNARRPQLEKAIPFQMLLPLRLRRGVSGKGDNLKEAVCMQELAVMFACFKKNEFDQAECLKEISAFKGCYKEYYENAKVQQEQGKKGVLVPGEKKMTHRQVNQLLKAFPPLK